MVVLVKNELNLNEISVSARSQCAHVTTLEYTRKTEVFCCFQGVWNKSIGHKGVKISMFIQGISIFKITCSNSITVTLEKGVKYA